MRPDYSVVHVYSDRERCGLGMHEIVHAVCILVQLELFRVLHPQHPASSNPPERQTPEAVIEVSKCISAL